MIRLAATAGAWLCALALTVPAAIGPATAADLALVIGNYNYTRAPDALSARADAEAVADALRQGGYNVISGTDLNRGEMRRLISDFAGRVEQSDRVVVFYSGHALRTAGRSYLSPVDQGNGSLVEVMMDGVPLELILELSARGGGDAVVFVDGAQLDGFTPRPFAEPGLAHIQPPDGVLVVSAAAPGRAIARRSTGRSDFGRQVVQEFLAPGATVRQAVRGLGQTAWVAGATDSSLALVPSGRTGTGTGTGQTSPATVEDRLNLTRAERSNLQEALTALGYNTRGTEGIFGSGTRSAIRNWQRANNSEATGYLTQQQVALIMQQGAEARAGAGERSPSEVEDRLNLTRAERSGIQENLVALGYDTRGTGGIFGSGTRTAIRNWQRAQNFEETGYLNREQVALINQQAAGTGTGQLSPSEVEDRLNLSGAQRSQIQEDLSRLGYDTRGTDGVFGPGTRTAIRNWQRAQNFEETGYLTQEQVTMIGRQSDQQAGAQPAPQDPASAEAQLDLARTDRLSIEQRLAYLGFPPGPQDGFIDSQTRQAIENYQASRGLPATGYLDRQTARRLVDETQGVRTGIVTGAQVLIDILEGITGQQQ